MNASQQQIQNLPTPSVKEEKTAEEQQLEQALKHLDHVHLKCRQLRTMIPRTLDILSLGQQANTTSGSLDGFLQAVKAGHKELEDFGTTYNDAESKKVFEQAKKSREANPKGIKPWRAKDHPDWMENAK
ncbi:hypothetical protein F5Y15DRAFT_135424 [Xylariaceae sp. FL0016]|nr:hypothetical protein F5Y15DRAFT_135424 [Xylariaceae sp. FL0016]